MRLTFILFYRAALMAALVMVAWQSLLPANGLQGIPHMDKVVHFLIYGLLCFLAVKAQLSKRYLWPFLGVISFGLLIEVLQGAMGWGRTASFWDMLANTLGAAVMLGLLKLFDKVRS